MTEQPMEMTFRTALWRQFGAAIDMLENALVACPASLWQERLWSVPPPPEFPPQFAEFWYVTLHALVWLDLYLSGLPEEEFAPPAPFAQGVLDSVEALPERPYTREELRAYLVSTLYWLLRTSVQERDPLGLLHLRFLMIRWYSAIDRRGEWFSCTRENTGVWATDHQGRHAKAAGEVCQRPLQTVRS